MMSKKDIRCLLLKIRECSAKLSYQIVLKEPKGYDTFELESKLAYLNVLRRMVEDAGCKCTKKIKQGYIQICGGKVLPSKNNPLLLNQTDIQLADSSCIDLCDVEAQVASMCPNC